MKVTSHWVFPMAVLGKVSARRAGAVFLVNFLEVDALPCYSGQAD